MSKFRRMIGFSQEAPSWPFGTDGALVYTGGSWTLNGVPVGSGSTYTLTNGQNKDFSSVSIDAGGTLEFTGWSGQWPTIGCAGNFVNNGTIKAYDFVNGTFNTTAPDDTSLSHTISYGSGGAGGSSGNNGTYGGSAGAGGLAGSTGNGGGGGSGGHVHTFPGYYKSGGNGSNASSSNGGTGANKIYVSEQSAGWNTTGGANTGGGSGAGLYGNTGGTGANTNTAYIYQGGAGGGGGSRGRDGGCIYFRIKGNISGNGSIATNGTNGGAGGAGGVGYTQRVTDTSGTTDWGGAPGGGGGGGGGGSGGKLVIKYSGTNTQTWSTPYAQGSGGSGGTAGSITDLGGTAAGAGQNGFPGNSGQTGVAPSITAV